MSEAFRQHLEELEQIERDHALPSPEHTQALPEHTAETVVEKDPVQTLAEARQQVAELSTSKNESEALEQLKTAEKTSEEPVGHHLVNRELKQITLNRELKHLQRKLPTPQRALSRVIHQPAVRMISEAAGKTISRPSGLLGGGLLALFGTSSYLYMAKHSGFSYNSSVFLLLFAAGFGLGLALELVVHFFVASRLEQ